MWIVREGVVKLYDVDVLFLLLVVSDVGLRSLLLVGIRGAKIDMVDVLMSVCLVLVVMVEWENVVFVVVVLLLHDVHLLYDVDVHRCRSS